MCSGTAQAHQQAFVRGFSVKYKGVSELSVGDDLVKFLLKINQ